MFNSLRHKADAPIDPNVRQSGIALLTAIIIAAIIIMVMM